MNANDISTDIIKKAYFIGFTENIYFYVLKISILVLIINM